MVRARVSPWPFAALVAMAGAFFLYAVALTVVPWWVGVGLVLAWGGLLVLVLRWFSSRPRTTVLVPLAAVALWYGVVAGGAAAYGWS